MSSALSRASNDRPVGRRRFLQLASASALCAWLPSSASAVGTQPRFDLSLVESSLSRSLADGAVDHLDFARLAKKEFGIEAVEYGARFFPAQMPPSENYLKEMNKRAAKHGVRQLLIAVEGDVRIADPAEMKRTQAMDLVRRWMDAAKALGCHSIQLNPMSSGESAEQGKRAAEMLARLCRYAENKKINVLLGNYGGLSAEAAWIEGVIQAVGSTCCRTLPRIKALKSDAEYQNLAKLVPLAKGMTAETAAFDPQGNETATDYAKAMQVIYESGYRGYVGINYRGSELDETTGIRATKKLLQRFREVPTES